MPELAGVAASGGTIVAFSAASAALEAENDKMINVNRIKRVFFIFFDPVMICVFVSFATAKGKMSLLFAEGELNILVL